MARSPKALDLQRPNEPRVLILTSLAARPKHGHALTRDVEVFAGASLGPGTLYGAIARLEEGGLISPVGGVDRRRPYRMCQWNGCTNRLRERDACHCRRGSISSRAWSRPSRPRHRSNICRVRSNPLRDDTALGIVAVDDPSRPAIGRAIFSTVWAAVVFSIFTGPVKQIKPLYNHAPWSNDPFDTIVPSQCSSFHSSLSAAWHVCRCAGDPNHFRTRAWST